MATYDLSIKSVFGYMECKKKLFRVGQEGGGQIGYLTLNGKYRFGA